VGWLLCGLVCVAARRTAVSGSRATSRLREPIYRVANEWEALSGELDGGNNLGRGDNIGSSRELGKRWRKGPERCGWSLDWWTPFYRGRGGVERPGDGSILVPSWLLNAPVTGVEAAVGEGRQRGRAI
jgi:hypothetical protein